MLASIRALVSAETEARVAGAGEADTVLMLTPDMRIDRRRRGAATCWPRGSSARPPAGRRRSSTRSRCATMINAIVREELQGELGDRISRNLRKLIRREIAEMLEEQRKG